MRPGDCQYYIGIHETIYFLYKIRMFDILYLDATPLASQKPHANKK